ncbi:ABC transporter permease, partial [Halobacterium salinarum]|nr:ABC transporter permease [Halobacterium salinarum]
GLGGVGGVVGGALATAAVTASAGVPTVVLVEWGSGAVAAGALLGAVAGLYPAWRAARTDPATAFRAT